MGCIKKTRTKEQLMEKEWRRINESWFMKAGRAGRKRWGGEEGGTEGEGRKNENRSSDHSERVELCRGILPWQHNRSRLHEKESQQREEHRDR